MDDMIGWTESLSPDDPLPFQDAGSLKQTYQRMSESYFVIPQAHLEPIIEGVEPITDDNMGVEGAEPVMNMGVGSTNDLKVVSAGDQTEHSEQSSPCGNGKLAWKSRSTRSW